MSRLQKKYCSEIVKNLQEKFSYKSVMQVPRVEKITLNMGIGGEENKKKIEFGMADLTKIAGQKPVITYARKSIAGFKLREDWPIGCKVTLRGSKMYEFLDRLITITLPRVRDFRGLSNKSFDGRGNYNLGIKEQIVFSEIEYDKIDTLRGLDIAITTSAKTDAEALALLEAFNFPFKSKEAK